MTNNSDATALLPCPFCGGEAVVAEHPAHEHSPAMKRIMPDFPDHTGSVDVSCLDCACGHLRDTREEAIDAWNRRTTTPPTDDEREGLARAIAPLVYATVTGNDDCREWEEMPEYVQDIYFQAADAALSALAPYRAAEIAAAHERGVSDERARVVAWLPPVWFSTDYNWRQAKSAIKRGEHDTGKEG